MKVSRHLNWFLVLLMASYACSFFTNLFPSVQGHASPGNTTSSSQGLTASATSPVIVELDWTAVEGAKNYRVELQIDESEFFPLALLPADQTSYLNFPAPSNDQITYRVVAVTEAGDGKTRMVTVTTPDLVPNPLTVTPHEYPNKPWVAPTPDPNHPGSVMPPGFDPAHPENFDPSLLLGTPPIASAEIGPEGGQLSVTSQDHVTYTLDVPPGALDGLLNLTLIPIQSIDNLPLSGGLVGSVRIEPLEYPFMIPATLTISAPEAPSPTDGMTGVAFAYNRDGSGFYLVPTANSSQAAFSPSDGIRLATLRSEHAGVPTLVTHGPKTIILHETGSRGVASGTQADIHNAVQNHAPADVSSQEAQSQAAAQAEEELAPDLPLRSTVSLSKEILDHAVEAGSYNQLMSALDDFRFYLENGGNNPALNSINNKILNELLVTAKAILEKNKLQCFTTDVNPQVLADQLSNPKDKFSIAFASAFQAKYGDKLIRDAANMVKKCKLTLQVTSAVSWQQPKNKVLAKAEVIAKIPLKWVYDKKVDISYLYGTGPITYQKLEISFDGCKEIPDTKDGSMFLVFRLEPIFSKNVLSDFNMKDYNMSGHTDKISHPKCKGKMPGWGKSANGSTDDLWGNAIYGPAHISNWAVEGWNVTVLQPGQSGVVAQHYFSGSLPHLLGGSVFEETLFKIIKNEP